MLDELDREPEARRDAIESLLGDQPAKKEKKIELPSKPGPSGPSLLMVFQKVKPQGNIGVDAERKMDVAAEISPRRAN